VTISGGVATSPADGDDVDTLLRNADAALYKAKRAGRNRVFSHSGTELSMGALEEEWPVDSDAETAIENDAETEIEKRED
jgi:predicted signal transduction protein with EAL and GGDEF domain